VSPDDAVCVGESRDAGAVGLLHHAVLTGPGGCALLVQTMRFQAPNLGGSFAVWGGLFSAFDCTLVAVRKKVGAVFVRLPTGEGQI
jgi:hypothetical protein